MREDNKNGGGTKWGSRLKQTVQVPRSARASRCTNKESCDTRQLHMEDLVDQEEGFSADPMAKEKELGYRVHISRATSNSNLQAIIIKQPSIKKEKKTKHSCLPYRGGQVEAQVT